MFTLLREHLSCTSEQRTGKDTMVQLLLRRCCDHTWLEQTERGPGKDARLQRRSPLSVSTPAWYDCEWALAPSPLANCSHHALSTRDNPLRVFRKDLLALGNVAVWERCGNDHGHSSSPPSVHQALAVLRARMRGRSSGHRSPFSTVAPGSVCARNRGI